MEEELLCRFFWVQFKWLGLSLGGGEIEQFLLVQFKWLRVILVWEVEWELRDSTTYMGQIVVYIWD